MSRFAIDPGHGNVNGSLGGDGGAVGYLIEQNCALDIANKVISKLKSLGHQAWNVRPSSASSVSDSLRKRCDKARTADYLISIHLNAGGGQGSEIFAMSTAGKNLANKVLKEIVALGFRNRGVKDGSNLYVIRNSRPVAMLIEICFVDKKSDTDLYNKIASDRIANAIVKGLTGRIPGNATKPNKPNNPNKGRDKKMKNLVVYGEGADKRAAEYMADYLKCPMISKNNLTKDIIDAVEKIYMIGGAKKPSSNSVLISGSDRYSTMKEVLKFIGK